MNLQFFSRPTRIAITAFTSLVLVFLWAPIIYAGLLAFNTQKSTILAGLTTKWWKPTFQDHEVRDALFGSVKVAIAATLVALTLGTMLAFALQRFRFFGRDAVSFIVVLPIALPGILTGLALNSAFRTLGLELGFLSVVIAHATFCVVVVHNNVLARLRRLSPSLEEASADLGADTFQTLRWVTFPMILSSLAAGAILAFALSFDEIVVTTFTAGPGFKTLPQYILSNFARANNLPKVNVAVLVVLVLSIVPVWFAQKLSESGPGMANTR
jgi:putative spermidine/putrescine transport system permease protein